MPCGIDLNLDELQEKLESLADGIFGNVESDASSALADAQSAADSFLETVRDTLGIEELLPELPSTDIPMEGEIGVLATINGLQNTNLDGLNAELSNLINQGVEEDNQLLIAAKARIAAKESEIAETKNEFLETYGDAIESSGHDLDTMLEDINDGNDICDVIPNIVTDENGETKEKVKVPLFAVEDPDPEIPSEETDDMKTLKSKIKDDFDKFNEELALPKVEVEDLDDDARNKVHAIIDGIGPKKLMEDVEETEEIVPSTILKEYFDVIKADITTKDKTNEITLRIPSKSPAQCKALLYESRK
jgi:hypothetical protein